MSTIVSIKGGLDTLIGLEKIKKRLKQEILHPLFHPELFPLGWPKGMLLYGPPGTGKTLLAAATANECHAKLAHITAADIVHSYVGESEKAIANLFAEARKKIMDENRPVFVFIDEADSIFGETENETGAEDRLRNQLLVELDGLDAKADKHLYLIAATNKPWEIPSNILRRLPLRVYLPLPDFTELTQHFDFYLNQIHAEPTAQQLADMFIGLNYSPSDIREICRKANAIAVSEIDDLEKPPKIILTKKHFMEAREKITPTVSGKKIEAYEKFGEMR